MPDERGKYLEFETVKEEWNVLDRFGRSGSREGACLRDQLIPASERTMVSRFS